MPRSTTRFNTTSASSAGHVYYYLLPVSHLKIGVTRHLWIVKYIQRTLAEFLSQQMIKSVQRTGITTGPFLQRHGDKLASGQPSQQRAGFQSQLCLQTSAPPLGSYVTLGRSLSLSEPLFLPVKDGTTHWAAWDSVQARQRKAEGAQASLQLYNPQPTFGPETQLCCLWE